MREAIGTMALPAVFLASAWSPAQVLLKEDFESDLSINSGDDVHCTFPVELPFKPTQGLKAEGNLHAEQARPVQ